MSAKLRILFVDDEPRVLRGFRRKLEPMYDKWDIKFVRSGAEALETLDLAEQPFDAIVTDMRMPGMNGATLLKEVRKRYPHMVRIILSGQADKEATLRTIGITHQYLSKPCNTETLISTLTRTCALRDLLATDNLKILIAQMKSLPSLPSLYLKLMEEIQSSDASTKTIGQIVAQDIGMTAKVLQLVNSAYFGLPRRIFDPAQAVVLLGLDTFKALVLSVHIFSHFDPSKLGGVSLNSLREHSLTVGVLAGQIAETEDVEPYLIECALTSGMLHDVGKLVLAANLPKEYDLALELMRDEEISLPEAERKLFGATHAEVGAYLLGLWGLADPIVEALAYHHDPIRSQGTEFSPLTAVHVANALTHEIRPMVRTKVISEVDTDYLTKLGLADRLPLWQDICRASIQKGITND